MAFKFDLTQTMGLAVLVYIMGMWIRNHVAFLKKYFIPSPVIGGLIFSVLIFLGIQTGTFKVTMNTSLQDYFMNIFFCATGFTCSIAIIKKKWQTGGNSGCWCGSSLSCSKYCWRILCRYVWHQQTARYRNGFNFHVGWCWLRCCFWPNPRKARC